MPVWRDTLHGRHSANNNLVTPRHSGPPLTRSYSPCGHLHIRFPNLVAHNYDDIDRNLVWDAICVSAPGLVGAVFDLVDDAQQHRGPPGIELWRRHTPASYRNAATPLTPPPGLLRHKDPLAGWVPSSPTFNEVLVEPHRDVHAG